MRDRPVGRRWTSPRASSLPAYRVASRRSARRITTGSSVADGQTRRSRRRPSRSEALFSVRGRCAGRSVAAQAWTEVQRRVTCGSREVHGTGWAMAADDERREQAIRSIKRRRGLVSQWCPSWSSTSSWSSSGCDRPGLLLPAWVMLGTGIILVLDFLNLRQRIGAISDEDIRREISKHATGLTGQSARPAGSLARGRALFPDVPRGHPAAVLPLPMGSHDAVTDAASRAAPASR